MRNPLLVFSMMTVAACSDATPDGGASPSEPDAEPRDGGGPDVRAPDPDAMPDGGPTDCVGADGLPCLTSLSGAPSRFDCTNAEPSGGTLQPLTLQIRSDDLDDFNARGSDLAIEIHPGDDIGDACEPPCVTLTADALGDVAADLPSPGWFSFRIAASTEADVAVSAGYRIFRPTDTLKRLAFMTNESIEATAGLVGKTRAPGTAVVGGSLYDCNDDPIAGATVRIFAGGNEVINGAAPTDPAIGYLSNRLPAPEAKTSDGSGWYGASNVPVTGDGIVRIEVYGTRSNGGPRELVGCEEARLFADGYTTRPVRPLRADYPGGHGCAAAAEK